MWKNQTDADYGAERVLELNGTIAEESWYDNDVTPQMFRDELFAGSGDIIIWINFPGGDCVAASQIYSMLMDYKGNVTVKIDGIGGLRRICYCYGGHKGAHGAFRPYDDPQSRHRGFR